VEEGAADAVDAEGIVEALVLLVMAVGLPNENPVNGFAAGAGDVPGTDDVDGADDAPKLNPDAGFGDAAGGAVLAEPNENGAEAGTGEADGIGKAAGLAVEPNENDVEGAGDEEGTGKAAGLAVEPNENDNPEADGLLSKDGFGN
jgi:hypothetical protein